MVQAFGLFDGQLTRPLCLVRPCDENMRLVAESRDHADARVSKGLHMAAVHLDQPQEQLWLPKSEEHPLPPGPTVGR